MCPAGLTLRISVAICLFTLTVAQIQYVNTAVYQTRCSSCYLKSEPQSLCGELLKVKDDYANYRGKMAFRRQARAARIRIAQINLKMKEFCPLNTSLECRGFHSAFVRTPLLATIAARLTTFQYSIHEVSGIVIAALDRDVRIQEENTCVRSKDPGSRAIKRKGLGSSIKFRIVPWIPSGNYKCNAKKRPSFDQSHIFAKNENVNPGWAHFLNGLGTLRTDVAVNAQYQRVCINKGNKNGVSGIYRLYAVTAKTCGALGNQHV